MIQLIWSLNSSVWSIKFHCENTFPNHPWRIHGTIDYIFTYTFNDHEWSVVLINPPLQSPALLLLYDLTPATVSHQGSCLGKKQKSKDQHLEHTAMKTPRFFRKALKHTNPNLDRPRFGLFHKKAWTHALYTIDSQLLQVKTVGIHVEPISMNLEWRCHLDI